LSSRPKVKSDLEIAQELAKRVGLAGLWRKCQRLEAALHRPELAPTASRETLEAGVVRNPLPKKVLFADRKFPTANGKVNLVTEEPARSADSPEFPLFMMSLSTEKSQSSHWAAPQDGPATVTVHPDAADGIEDGALCRMESMMVP
jgi:hypothetical protein